MYRALKSLKIAAFERPCQLGTFSPSLKVLILPHKILLKIQSIQLQTYRNLSTTSKVKITKYMTLSPIFPKM